MCLQAHTCAHPWDRNVHHVHTLTGAHSHPRVLTHTYQDSRTDQHTLALPSSQTEAPPVQTALAVSVTIPQVHLVPKAVFGVASCKSQEDFSIFTARKGRRESCTRVSLLARRDRVAQELSSQRNHSRARRPTSSGAGRKRV